MGREPPAVPGHRTQRGNRLITVIAFAKPKPGEAASDVEAPVVRRTQRFTDGHVAGVVRIQSDARGLVLLQQTLALPAAVAVYALVHRFFV